MMMNKTQKAGLNKRKSKKKKGKKKEKRKRIGNEICLCIFMMLVGEKLTPSCLRQMSEVLLV